MDLSPQTSGPADDLRSPARGANVCSFHRILKALTRYAVSPRCRVFFGLSGKLRSPSGVRCDEVFVTRDASKTWQAMPLSGDVQYAACG